MRRSPASSRGAGNSRKTAKIGPGWGRLCVHQGRHLVAARGVSHAAAPRLPQNSSILAGIAQEFRPGDGRGAPLQPHRRPLREFKGRLREHRVFIGCAAGAACALGLLRVSGPAAQGTVCPQCGTRGVSPSAWGSVSPPQRAVSPSM